MPDEGPDEGEPSSGGLSYELRFTMRALDDLDCPADTAPGDLDDIEQATRQRAIARKFRALRREVPTGTQPPMRVAMSTALASSDHSRR